MREWLRAMRINLGLSQGDVAKAIEISQPSYCNIEKGERRPAPETAKKLGVLFGFDWTRFYEDPTDQKIAQ